MKEWIQCRESSDIFWLESLKEAHSNLAQAISALEGLTRGPVPAKERLVEARYKLSKASLERRLLWGRIHAYLARSASREAESDLRKLQQSDIALLRAAASHVGKWTTDVIFEDWLGYCRASAAMRVKLTDAAALEERLLYPLLQARGGKRR
jgi:hypothetical protein